MKAADHLSLILTVMDRLEMESTTNIADRVSALQAIANAANQAAARLNRLAEYRQDARQPAPWKNQTGSGY